jgi:hemerythrin-like domain-containing protein
MFDFMEDGKSAISLLKDDHSKVKDLFDRFEKSQSQDEREQIAATVIEELKAHTVIEEEIFYPAVRKTVESDIMNEANEEHHVAKFLIAELEAMDSKDERFAAKFKVLAEGVRHHIKEEEGEMFPQAKDSGLDLDALGKELQKRKQELKKEGFPASPEEKLVAHKRASASPKARRSPRGKAHMQPHHRNSHDTGRGARTSS